MQSAHYIMRGAQQAASFRRIETVFILVGNS